MNKNKIAIKARVYNKIRTRLYKKKLEDISIDEKVIIFNEIFKDNHEAHWELVNYKNKLKDKKELYNARVARGYKFKVKKSKEEFENSKK